MPLTHVMEFPGRCEECNPRSGRKCGLPAVAVRIHPISGERYPVCMHHAHGSLVPLTEIIRFARSHLDVPRRTRA